MHELTPRLLSDALGWNMSVLPVGLMNQLKVYLNKERIVVLCLQETMKHDLAGHELQSLELEGKFH
jgi:hypothetical protein